MVRVERSADVMTQATPGLTPLYRASQARRTCIAWVLQYDADPPAHKASAGGYRRFMELLSNYAAE